MIRFLEKISLLLAVAFSHFGLFSQTPPQPYSSECMKFFAETLFFEGFYDEAESEFKRYLFSANKIDFEALSFLLSIYDVTDDEEGVVFLKTHFYDDAHVVFREKLNLVHGKFLFEKRDVSGFSSLLSSIESDFFSFSFRTKSLLSFSKTLLDGDFNETLRLVDSVSESDSAFSSLKNICASYSPKSCGVAVGLSALVPGLGKWYGGAFKNGLRDFASVSLCAAGAVYSTMKEGRVNWRTYAFASLGILLFSVDLYGSYKNVTRYNNAMKRRIYDEVSNLYDEFY